MHLSWTGGGSVNFQITEDEAKALARAFRLVVTQNVEDRANKKCEGVVVFADDMRTLERLGRRMGKQLNKKQS